MAADLRRPLVAVPRALGVLRLRREPDIEAERHATWLELFLDLVFVLALSAVTARLGSTEMPTLSQVVAAAGIYILVQWAWVGQAFYDTRFDPDDVPHKVLVLLAAAGAGAIALGVRDVPAGAQLPIGYLVVRGTLILMYLRVLASDRSSREVVVVYLSGFSVGWLLWLASLWLSSSNRPVLWTVAVGIELATPWLGRRWLLRHPVHRSHLPERIGQFIIILLGLSLTNLIDAVPVSHPTFRVLVAGALALLVPVGIWWVYAAFLNSRLAVPRLASGAGYAYLHVPIGAGILFAGWGLGRAVHLADVGHRLPLAARVVVAASIITWMLGSLGMNWFSRGALSVHKVVMAALGIAPLVAVAAFVTDPLLLLAPTAVILVGYAAATTTQIAQARPPR